MVCFNNLTFVLGPSRLTVGYIVASIYIVHYGPMLHRIEPTHKHFIGESSQQIFGAFAEIWLARYSDMVTICIRKHL